MFSQVFRVVRYALAAAILAGVGIAVSLPSSGAGAATTIVPKIVFTLNDPTSFKPTVWVMNPDGSGQSEVTHVGSDGGPSLSPDGTKIAYGSSEGGSGALWIVNADGTSKHQLMMPPSGCGDSHPDWSPDGSKLVFMRGCSDTTLWIVNADGTSATQVPLAAPLSNGTFHGDARFSPDGTKLVLDSNSSGSTEVWTVHADGTSPVKLTSSGGSVPSWSPDGSKIVFASPDATNVNISHIWLMNADGSSPVQLTNSPDTIPSFSPDGKTVAYQSGSGGTTSIATMNADGSNQQAITSADSYRSPRFGVVAVATPPTTTSSSTSSSSTSTSTSSTSTSTSSTTSSSTSSTSTSTTSTTLPTTTSTSTSTTLPPSTTSTTRPPSTTTSQPSGSTSTTVSPSTSTSTPASSSTTSSTVRPTTPSTTPAAAGAATSHVSSQTVQPGQQVTSSGEGWGANQSLTITFNSEPVLLTTTTADSAGRYSVVVTIPVNATPGAHSIETRSSTQSSTVAITVVSGTNALPRTGFGSLVRLTTLAVALIIAGVAFRRHRRLRRQ